MDYFQDKNEDGRRIRQEKVNTKKYIYLGDLPPNTDRYQLYQFITSQEGNLEIEDTVILGNSEKPFAYVKFKTKESAEKALNILHLKTFKNHIIKAEPYKSSNKKDSKKLNTNLFVKNLPKDTTPKELYDIFVNYGTIDSIYIKTNKKGECVGYGYINFTTEESAKNAIDKLNQTKFKDAELLVSLFTPKEKRLENLGTAELMEPLLIIRNIPEEMDDIQLKNTFDIYGQIMISGILTDPPSLNMEKKESSDNMEGGADEEKKDDDNKENRYGVVLYSSKDEAKAAMSQLKDKYELELIPIDNNIIERIKKKKHDKMKEKYAGSNLIVKDLPKEIDDKKLFSIFKKYGEISSARVQVQGVMKEIKNESGEIVDKQFVYESKGFGYVLFKKEADAQKSKEELNEKEFEFEGIKLRLLIEYFDYDKGEKNKLEQFQREMGFNNRRGGFQGNTGDHLRGMRGAPSRGAGRGRGRGFGERGGHLAGYNNYPMGPGPQQVGGVSINNMNNMNNINNMNNMNNLNNTNQNRKNIQKMPMIESKVFQEDKITVESVNLVQKIKDKLKIENPEERTENIGEVLFYFLIKFIPQYNLNDTNGACDDSSLCSKLTGILIRTDTNNLLNIISSTEKLYNSLRDVVNKLNPANNN